MDNTTFSYTIIADRVNHAALITKPPLNTTVVLGANVTFPCTVLSDLHKHVQWVYQRQDSNSSQRTALKVMVV